MTRAIEIAIRAKANGKRVALYRTVGTMSRYWHAMPVRQAEKALRDGVASIGVWQNVHAVPFLLAQSVEARAALAKVEP